MSHYGYSPDYYRYGYYSPTWGYDPYGFAWGPRGTIRYTTTYRRHPRPSVLNPYWSGWDWHRTDWKKGHWSWRDGRDGRRGRRFVALGPPPGARTQHQQREEREQGETLPTLSAGAGTSTHAWIIPSGSGRSRGRPCHPPSGSLK